VTRDWVGGLREMFRPRQFKQTAPSPWAPTQPVIQAPPEPQSNINTAELQLGETRECRRYRPKTVQDLMPHLLYSAISGVAGGGIAYGFGGIEQQVIGWASGVFILAFLIFGGVALLTKEGTSALTMLEKLARTDINGDGQNGLPQQDTIPIEHNRDRGGLAKRQLGGIPVPAAGREALGRWFWLICRQNGDGFSIRIAKRYKITPAEVGQVQVWFLTQEPPLAERGGNNWIRPNDEGIETMWGVVMRYYPDATLPSDCERIV